MNKIKFNSKSKQYGWLSNMYECTVPYQVVTYKSAESAFQAQKCASEFVKNKFTDLDGFQARELGRKVKLASDWDQVKMTIMHDILMAKFSNNDELHDQLLATGDSELIEHAPWERYSFWGIGKEGGLNNTGHLLMQIRNELREFQLFYESEADELDGDMYFSFIKAQEMGIK